MVKEKVKLPVKKYFTIKIETLAPVEITCKVFAEDAEEALAMVTKAPTRYVVNTGKPTLSKMKRITAKVYKFGSTIIELVKRF